MKVYNAIPGLATFASYSTSSNALASCPNEGDSSSTTYARPLRHQHPVNTLQAEERILTVAEIRDLEVRNIQAALKRTNGKIYGDDGAAALLSMKPTTLVSRIKSLNSKYLG